MQRAHVGLADEHRRSDYFIEDGGNAAFAGVQRADRMQPIDRTEVPGELRIGSRKLRLEPLALGDVERIHNQRLQPAFRVANSADAGIRPHRRAVAPHEPHLALEIGATGDVRIELHADARQVLAMRDIAQPFLEQFFARVVQHLAEPIVYILDSSVERQLADRSIGLGDERLQPRLVRAQRRLGALALADIDEGQHRAFDDVLGRPIRPDAHQVPLPALDLHFRLDRRQRVEDRPDVFDQPVVADEVRHDVLDRPPDIGRNQVDDLRRRRREARDPELMIDEHRADAGSGEQVVHVVVDPRQVGHLVL